MYSEREPSWEGWGMYMSVDWHSGHHSSSAFAHKGHAAKPWALPEGFQHNSPGAEGRKAKQPWVEAIGTCVVPTEEGSR